MIRWIASYPKSGNTWVRAFLTAHLYGALDINNIRVPSDANTKLYNAVSARPVETLPHEQQALLRPAALLNAVHWRQPLYLKTHGLFDSRLGSLNGPSIYLIRDPRDVVASMMDHNDFGFDSAHLALSKGCPWLHQGIFQDVRSWSENVVSWEEHATVIRYEDLRSVPKKNFGRILRTLGIEGSPTKAIKMASLENLRAQEKAHGFREKKSTLPFFREGKVGGWKDVLSNTQADAIVADNKEIMDRYGYL